MPRSSTTTLPDLTTFSHSASSSLLMLPTSLSMATMRLATASRSLALALSDSMRMRSFSRISSNSRISWPYFAALSCVFFGNRCTYWSIWLGRAGVLSGIPSCLSAGLLSFTTRLSCLSALSFVLVASWAAAGAVACSSSSADVILPITLLADLVYSMSGSHVSQKEINAVSRRDPSKKALHSESFHDVQHCSMF